MQDVKVGQMLDLNQHPDIFTLSANAGGTPREKGVVGNPPHTVEKVGQEVQVEQLDFPHPSTFPLAKIKSGDFPTSSIFPLAKTNDYPSLYSLAKTKPSSNNDYPSTFPLAKTRSSSDEKEVNYLGKTRPLEHPSIFLQSAEKDEAGEKSLDIDSVEHPSIYTLSKVLSKGKAFRKGGFKVKLKRAKEKSEALKKAKEQESLELLNSGYPAPVDEANLKKGFSNGSISTPGKVKNPPRMDVWFSLKPAPALAPTIPPRELAKPTKPSKDLSPAMRTHEYENVETNSTAAHILPWYVSFGNPFHFLHCDNSSQVCFEPPPRLASSTTEAETRVSGIFSSPQSFCENKDKETRVSGVFSSPQSFCENNQEEDKEAEKEFSRKNSTSSIVAAFSASSTTGNWSDPTFLSYLSLVLIVSNYQKTLSC